MQIIKTEIAVVGGGPGGQSAALQAAQLGRKVIIFEKKDHLGGAMNGGSGPFAVDTIQQRRLQRVVTKAEAFKFFMDFTHWEVDPGLVSAYVNKSAETLQWLESFGCVFDSLNAYIEGGNHTWHEYTMGPEGFICDRMWREEEKLGVEAILNCRVKKLTVKDGKVCGFIAEKDGEDVEVTAEAVVIATGGFGNNAEMVKEYTPYELGKTIIPMTQGCDGEGLQMAWEVGAAKGFMFYDAFAGILHPFYGGPGGFCAELRSLRQPNLMVNERAERFVDEFVLTNGAYGINAIRRQPGNCAYMIVTDEIVDSYKKDGFVITLPSKDPFTNQWTDWPERFEEKMKELTEEGFSEVFMADSIEELAEKMGMDPEKLQATVDRYNQMCEDKYDSDFHKKQELLKPIKGNKYYACRVFANSYGTLGGININKNAEVLDSNGYPIPGLYAAGNDANTICKDSYCFGMPGHTSGFAFNTGRIAAESIDAYLKER
ncbi:MAG: FAD-dependent oxidoreductase [Lachnospiraceae bacterium]|nr:FAD-dependent oxidoreductase [Lachnospiraceae bacterium]